jgi:hypothetical protein
MIPISPVPLLAAPGGGLGLVLVLALAAVSCTDGAAAQGSPDAGAACKLPPPGEFTFRVQNAGAVPLVVDLGCGLTVPITLDTPSGPLPAGAGNVDACGFTCEQVYAGQVVPGACTDCGPGIVKTIAPGGTAEIRWDRRGYVGQSVVPGCAPAPGSCAAGVAIAGAPAQAGSLTTCPSDQRPTGSCLQPKLTPFTIDTTGADAVIEVR